MSNYNWYSFCLSSSLALALAALSNNAKAELPGTHRSLAFAQSESASGGCNGKDACWLLVLPSYSTNNGQTYEEPNDYFKCSLLDRKPWVATCELNYTALSAFTDELTVKVDWMFDATAMDSDVASGEQYWYVPHLLYPGAPSYPCTWDMDLSDFTASTSEMGGLLTDDWVQPITNYSNPLDPLAQEVYIVHKFVDSDGNNVTSCTAGLIVIKTV